jgi:hypothetical protein
MAGRLVWRNLPAMVATALAALWGPFVFYYLVFRILGEPRPPFVWWRWLISPEAVGIVTAGIVVLVCIELVRHSHRWSLKDVLGALLAAPLLVVVGACFLTLTFTTFVAVLRAGGPIAAALVLDAMIAAAVAAVLTVPHLGSLLARARRGDG